MRRKNVLKCLIHHYPSYQWKTGKSFVAIVGDNRLDMNPSGDQNLYLWGRLWRDFNLTRFSCITYPVVILLFLSPYQVSKEN